MPLPRVDIPRSNSMPNLYLNMEVPVGQGNPIIQEQPQVQVNPQIQNDPVVHQAAVNGVGPDMQPGNELFS